MRFNDPEVVWADTRGLAELRYEPRLSEQFRLLTRVVANLSTFEGTYRYDSETVGEVDESNEDYLGQWFVGEARGIWEPKESLRLSFGAEAGISTRASLHGIGVGDTDPYLDEDGSYQTFAGYGLADWSPNDWFKLTAGVRADFW